MEEPISYNPASVRIETPTSSLRWFVKKGPPGAVNAPTLQQQVAWRSADGTTGGLDWRDVPVVHEEPKP